MTTYGYLIRRGGGSGSRQAGTGRRQCGHSVIRWYLVDYLEEIQPYLGACVFNGYLRLYGSPLVTAYAGDYGQLGGAAGFKFVLGYVE